MRFLSKITRKSDSVAAFWGFWGAVVGCGVGGCNLGVVSPHFLSVRNSCIFVLYDLLTIMQLKAD